MRFLVGPDSLKDSVSAIEFCEIAKKLIHDRYPDDEVIALPLADGGEGTVDALISSGDGKKVELEVTGPLGRKITTYYGILGDGTAVIEMAKASGIELVEIDERNPMETTTYGTGEIILDAIKRGCTRLIIGIGGSATTDAGLGMMQALGYRCLDKNGEDIVRGGKGMLDLMQILPPKTHEIDFQKLTIEVACDVTNPLFGKNGAAYIYAPQKGADHQMVIDLDAGLRNFAKVAEQSFGRDISNLAGAGAAGGLGAGICLALHGELLKGFEIVRNQLHLDEILNSSIDYVITSEGQINSQSLQGKLPVELAKLARKHNIPTVVIVGASDVSVDEVKQIGIQGIFPIQNGPMTLDQSISMGKQLIEETLKNILNLIHF